MACDVDRASALILFIYGFGNKWVRHSRKNWLEHERYRNQVFAIRARPNSIAMARR